MPKVNRTPNAPLGQGNHFPNILEGCSSNTNSNYPNLFQNTPHSFPSLGMYNYHQNYTPYMWYPIAIPSPFWGGMMPGYLPYPYPQFPVPKGI